MLGAAGVNAFDHSWLLPDGQLSYICPPHMLALRVIRKVLDEQCDCILVLPAWYKLWHGLLLLLPIKAQLHLAGTMVVWGDRAPPASDRCVALAAGLRAYLILW